MAMIDLPYAPEKKYFTVHIGWTDGRLWSLSEHSGRERKIPKLHC
jgi:hypothetical protein